MKHHNITLTTLRPPAAFMVDVPDEQVEELTLIDTVVAELAPDTSTALSS